MILAKTASRLVERWNQSLPHRRGVVLLAVLIVVVMLSLAAYQYGDLMLSEHKATVNAHRSAQARSLADSGVHYAAALLASPDSIANVLNGNPWHNPDAFQDVEVQGDPASRNKGRFSIISPVDPGDSDLPGGVRYGVLDEGGRMNLNSLLKLDPSGDLAHAMLMKLPNMTDEVANAIVDWIDSDTTPRTGGAESDYYGGLSPAYRCKNGPLDSIEELLLVKGVTKELLFGSDLNRNGVQDADEADNGGFDRGWSAFLTVFSRESNRDSEGVSYVYLNNTDLEDMYNKLSPAIGEDMAKYLVMYRQYGPSNAAGQTQSLGTSIAKALGFSSSGDSSGTTSTKPGVLADYELKFTRSGSTKLKSVFDLVNTQVSISKTDPTTRKKTTLLYPCPLNNLDGQRELLPKLFESSTLFEETEIPARININTAPPEVLATLPELTDTDLQNILAARPKTSAADSPSEIYQTPAWLLTEANLRIDLLRKLDKYVTTRSQVFRVQVVGYFDEKGPSARVEAVIDVNAGRPRIVAWRDLSELGKGLETTKK